jgi:hypothetical protein
MKKTIIYAFMLGALVFVSSCKCQTCKHPTLGTSKLCKDDFNSTTDFNNAVDLAEAGGYDCKASN